MRNGEFKQVSEGTTLRKTDEDRDHYLLLRAHIHQPHLILTTILKDQYHAFPFLQWEKLTFRDINTLPQGRDFMGCGAGIEPRLESVPRP